MWQSSCLTVLLLAGISNTLEPAAEHTRDALNYPSRDPVCTKRNSYYVVEGNCDSYIECRDYYAQEMLCPDGLHYNAEAVWPAYPCGYPMDVPCRGRSIAQPALATAECPHQYGFYASAVASPSNCGQYRMCVSGKAIEMLCAPGLAFNPESARCDWPDLVPTCDSEAFLNFKCPAHPVDQRGEPLDIVLNYRYPNNCYSFYSCEKGRARLLTCDVGFAFDESSGHCKDADLVACPHA